MVDKAWPSQDKGQVTVLACAGMLETGFQIDSLHQAQSFTTYESHVLFALRFMIDCSITGGNWVELKAGAYKLLSMDDSRKQSHCQLEAHVNYADIISHPAEGQLKLPNHLTAKLRMCTSIERDDISLSQSYQSPRHWILHQPTRFPAIVCGTLKLSKFLSSITLHHQGPASNVWAR